MAPEDEEKLSASANGGQETSAETSKPDVEVAVPETGKMQVVKSNSKAYGYNYASLADIVKQGFKIPVMEIRFVEGQMFMGWFADDKQWHCGAPVIVPEMRGANAAQAMGAALSYSRRYTAQMALGLACDDDAKLEKTKDAPETTGRVYSTSSRISFAEVRDKLSTINNLNELSQYWTDLHLSEKQANILKADFSRRKMQLEGGANNGLV